MKGVLLPLLLLLLQLGTSITAHKIQTSKLPTLKDYRSLKISTVSTRFDTSIPRGGKILPRGTSIHEKSELMDGKMRSFVTRVNTFGKTLFFFCMIFRSLSSLESADKLKSDLSRLIIGVPLLISLLGNVLAFVNNVLHPVRYKRYIQWVTFMNFFRELAEIVLNLTFLLYKMVTYRHMLGSHAVYRQLYHNLFWLLICWQYQ